MEISLTTLENYFTDAADSSTNARHNSEKARDYYDGIQLTAEEIAELKRRKQPPTVFNRIKPKIDFLIGMEQNARTDPNAFPRTFGHEEAANAATDSIRFVCDKNKFDGISSEVFYNESIEGLGGVSVEVDPKTLDIKLKRVRWDRYFYDPHGREKDHSDCRYDGIVIWMDFSEAKEKWKDKAENLDTMMELESFGETYEDKPSNRQWYDSERNRVMVIEINFLHRGTWHKAIFTKGQMLDEPEPIAYLDEDGLPENNFIMRAANITRQGARYGSVKNLIDVQDEINKRRSKSLHILNTRQTFSKRGRLDNINQFKREANKPDGHLEFPSEGEFGRDFGVIPDAGLAASQFQMYQESKQEMDSVGSNAALAGKTEGISGKAVQSLQQGGTIELGPLFDGHYEWKNRVYAAIWNRIKQFWTAEKWVRVTDDEKNLRWVGLNQPVTAAEQMIMDKTGMKLSEVKENYEAELQQLYAQKPELGEVQKIQNDVAEIDVDIILDQVPDVVNLQSEQFDMLVKMYQANPNGIPWESIIKMSSLRNKDKILGEDDEAKQELMQQQQEIQQTLAALEMGKTESEIEKNLAQAEKTTQEATQKQIENALIMSDPDSVSVAI